MFIFWGSKGYVCKENEVTLKSDRRGEALETLARPNYKKTFGA